MSHFLSNKFDRCKSPIRFTGWDGRTFIGGDHDELEHEFAVNDRVVTTGFSEYNTDIPIGTVGTVTRIRHRYKNSPDEHRQYKISFPNFPARMNDDRDLYTSFNLRPYDNASDGHTSRWDTFVSGGHDESADESEHEFAVNDRVVTTGFSDYNTQSDVKIPIGTVGTVTRIRYRYRNSPSEYKQYKVSFPNFPERGNDDMLNVYRSFNLRPYDHGF